MILLKLDSEFQRAQGNGFSKWRLSKISERPSTVKSFKN